ncbi:MAG: NifB/NifX family molybdenum-iron cluster-binding protein [Thermoanaerobaculales bacterium]|jgi:FKBP-type peptidyl-prolyl cis-trans isomerase 2/predicted Fe-Mo cluster-binding NifX family protein|nr:NifB/NifX family molybdenum-iron cluster-binding protein [Thermoanaerobaculales bacterium]
MLIAVPSENPGGLDAVISEHFGHCGVFTLVTVEDDTIGDATLLENVAHEHGGCMGPVMLLKDNGVDVLLAGGMGGRPLAGFQEVGIAVHYKENAGSVREAIELYLGGGCRAFGEAQTCGGGGGGCDHDHDHQEPVREPIEGVKDIREGRLITLDFELGDSQGNVLDSSTRVGPMRYLHGAGMLLPALENAIAGLEEGATKTVAIDCDEAFGRRDEARIIEVQRSQMPTDVGVGDMVAGQDAGGAQIPLRIVAMDEATATLDGNHPFADKDVVFKVTVKTVENATAEEMAHIRAH